MEVEKPRFSILMFPWLAHGHIFPYLELAKRILIRKNFRIYLCTTPINFSSIHDFLQKNLLKNSIELVELQLEPFTQLPPHYHTTKNLPSHLNFTLIKAFQTSNSSFVHIITSLKPDLIIYDIFQPWVSNVASSQGIPCVHFAGFGAATVSIIHHQYTESQDANFPFPQLCLRGREKESVDNLINFLAANIFHGNKDIFYENIKLSGDIVLLKTSKAFEGKYIDYVSSCFMKKRIVAVGPLVTDATDTEDSEIIQWLNKKNQHSTVYISFGSEYFLSREEIEEIAKGLELSEVNFIWIIRFPVGESKSIEEWVPGGFLERVKGRGMVVTGWAPQAKILTHPNTGGFVSHCGWSSITESVYFGVPIIGMPMKLNMFIDAKMVAEAGVCVVVPRDENNKNAFKGENIGKVIREVIMGKSGEGLRAKAREISNNMKIEELEALDEAAKQLWHICSSKNS